MPLFSPKRKVSDTENKLRVLFCLDKLGMATQEQLWPFVARLELMDYVPFCLFVDELKKNGAVAAGSYALEGMLYLTQTGRQQLQLFAGRLVHADRERIACEAPRYRDELSTRKQVRAAYELAEDGRFSAAMTLREADVPTLFLRMNTAAQERVGEAVRGFHARAPQVLNLLYTLDLLPDPSAAPRPLSQDEAIERAVPGKPALCAFGGREHAGVACVETDDTRYTVLLLLPGAQLAWDWARAADRSGGKLAREVTAVLNPGAEAQT